MTSIRKRGRHWRAQMVRRGYSPQYRTFDTRAEAEAWTRGMAGQTLMRLFATAEHDVVSGVGERQLGQREDELTVRRRALKDEACQVAVHRKLGRLHLAAC